MALDRHSGGPDSPNVSIDRSSRSDGTRWGDRPFKTSSHRSRGLETLKQEEIDRSDRSRNIYGAGTRHGAGTRKPRAQHPYREGLYFRVEYPRAEELETDFERRKIHADPAKSGEPETAGFCSPDRRCREVVHAYQPVADSNPGAGVISVDPINSQRPRPQIFVLPDGSSVGGRRASHE